MVAVTSDCGSTGMGNDNRTAIAVLARLKANTEQLQKQGETFVHAIERLEDRIDKRFEEVNHRFTEVNQRLTDMQASNP